MNAVSKPLDSQQSKRSEVDANDALAQFEDESPAATAKKPAAAMSVQFCDDCMRIDFDKLRVEQYPGEEIPILNVETCPMCAFLHAALVREGIKFPNEFNFWLCEAFFFEGWILDVHSKDRWYYNDSKRVCLQLASDPWHTRLADYGFIAKWLDDCVKCHGHQCFNNRWDLGLVPGLQFIDCIARRMIPASEAVDRVYLTLSYVWGAPSGSTSGIVEENNSVSTLPIRLPRVVEDSIKVVKELGFRYLWVDRYCIPQADSRAKHTQIQLMGRIYAHSAITIVAAAGEDAEYGLPGVDARERNPQLRIDLESVHGNPRLPPSLMVYHPLGDDIRSSLWNTRGWTYQEALLSKRRLVFTDNQVFFECQHMLCEESPTVAELRSRKRVFPYPADFEKPWTVWERINEFLKRTLSFEHDALDAISGILNMYRKDRSEDGNIAFLCGMPLFPKLSVHQVGGTTSQCGESASPWHSSLYVLWDMPLFPKLSVHQVGGTTSQCGESASPWHSSLYVLWDMPLFPELSVHQIGGTTSKCGESASPWHSSLYFLWDMPLFPELSVHQIGGTTSKRGESARLWHSSLYGPTVLIRGLLWIGHWDEKPIGVRKAELSSTKLERPRRSEFPSWTWVGWKDTSRYALRVEGSDDISESSKCAIRAVYEECQMNMDWDKDAEQILANSALGLNPKFLDIKGTCFDVSLAWSKTGVDDSDACGWVSTKPLVFNSSSRGFRYLRIPPNTLEEGEGKVHELVALLLVNSWDTWQRVCMEFLLVQPVEYSAGRWVYERITCSSLSWNLDVRAESVEARYRSLSEQLGAIFEERELRLR